MVHVRIRHEQIEDATANVGSIPPSEVAALIDLLKQAGGNISVPEDESGLLLFFSSVDVAFTPSEDDSVRCTIWVGFHEDDPG